MWGHVEIKSEALQCTVCVSTVMSQAERENTEPCSNTVHFNDSLCK